MDEESASPIKETGETIAAAEKQEDKVADDADSDDSAASNGKEENLDASGDDDSDGEDEDADTVKFPLDRRPDDPGVDPEKAPAKKGFGLF